MEKIRLLVVDDDEQICKSIKIILSKDEQIEVVGFAHNGEEAISNYMILHPDLVLMDIRMPVMDGIQASSVMMSKDPAAKILLLSTFSDEEYIIKAFQIGVRGYIIKQEYKKIAPAIKSVINGQFVFADEVIVTLPKYLMQFNGAHNFGKKESAYHLSEKEKMILELVSSGFTNKEIAEKMHFSAGTIRNNISALLEKLDLKNRTQLAAFYSEYSEELSE